MLAHDTSLYENTIPSSAKGLGNILHAQDRFEAKKTRDHHKNTFENLNRLHSLVDGQNNQSFDSLEGLPNDTKKTDWKVILRDTVPAVGLALASGMHLIAGFSKATHTIPEFITNFFDKHALSASKAANLWNYLAKGTTALMNGRSWDGIARLTYVIPAFASLENFFLFSGISSGLSMMEQGHMDKTKLAELKHDTNTNISKQIIDASKHLIKDFKDNVNAFVGKIKEVYSHGIGKNRLILKNRAVEEKYKGTMFVSSFANFFGAVLGILSPSKDSIFRKIAALIRNAGGLGCDWGKFFHADPNNRNSAIAYLAVSMLDVVQTFTPEPFATVLSHFSLSVNNLANFFYVNTSKARDEGSYKQNSSLALAA